MTINVLRFFGQSRGILAIRGYKHKRLCVYDFYIIEISFLVLRMQLHVYDKTIFE